MGDPIHGEFELNLESVVKKLGENLNPAVVSAACMHACMYALRLTGVI